MKQYSTTFIVASIITFILTLLVLIHYAQIGSRKGTIVLPAGGTYLGPTNTPTTPPAAPVPAPGTTHKGRFYPYSFETPASVHLVTFPSDRTYDIYAIAKEGLDPYNAVLIGVDDISKKQRPLTDYVNDWWKQFSGLKGVKSLVEFTNSQGLNGYKAVFTGGSSEDIFFSSPDGKYIIHLANGPLTKEEFDAIVDSVAWTK